jgi:hypothetical protein
MADNILGLLHTPCRVASRSSEEEAVDRRRGFRLSGRLARHQMSAAAAHG